MCIIAVLAALEGYRPREVSFELVTGIVVTLAGGAVGVWSFLRYVRKLLVAQYAADSSVCPKCKTYGLLDATGPAFPSGRKDAEVAIAPTPVRCRKCGDE